MGANSPSKMSDRLLCLALALGPLLCPPTAPGGGPRPWAAEAFTFSYLAKPPMTAGSTIPFRSMDRGLMGRLSSLWYWFIIIRIFSLAVDMVSMAFSSGLMVVCWKRDHRNERAVAGCFKTDTGLGRDFTQGWNSNEPVLPVGQGVAN